MISHIKLLISSHRRWIHALGVFLFFGAAFLLVPKSHALANAPLVYIQAGDGHSSQPNHPGDCGNPPALPLGPDSSYSEDLDCARVQLTNAASEVYDEDFQICIYFNDAVSCTPWASEGGGFGPQVIGGNSLHYLAIRTNHRALPPELTGTTFSAVGVGVQLYYRSNNHGHPSNLPCGGSSGPSFSSGDNQPSAWAFGEFNDDDPGCGRAGLTVTTNSPYNAHYVNSSLANTTVQGGTQVSAFNVVMSNAGHFWPSDTTVSQTGNCDNYQPGPNAGVCEYDEVLTSSSIKLKRLNDGVPIDLGGTLFPYRRSVHVTYSSQHITWTEWECNGAFLNRPQNWLAWLWNKIVPSALALPPETEHCTRVTEDMWIPVVSRDRSENVLAPDETNFDLPSFTAPTAAGTYVLRFQMVKTDGPGGGTVPCGNNFCFGDIGEVPFTVQPVIGGAYTLSLTPADVVINQGQDAMFYLSSTCSGNFAGPITNLVVTTGFGTSINAELRRTQINCNVTNGVPLYISNTANANPLDIARTVQVNGDVPPNVAATPAAASLTIRRVSGSAPYVDISASPNPVERGHTTVITWAVTGDADNCEASGGWSGPKDHVTGVTYHEDSQSLFNPTTFTLHCSNAYGEDTQSVTVDVFQLNPDFGLSCTPAQIPNLMRGQTGSYDLSTTSVDGFSSPVTFSTQSLIRLGPPEDLPGGDPVVSYTNNGRVPPGTTSADISTNGSTTLGTYRITFAGTGGGITHTCVKEVTVENGPSINPEAPTVSADNSACGQVTVNWQPQGSVVPTGYRVYRGSSPTGPWTLISNVPPNPDPLSAETRSFVDRNGASSNNYYMVRAYNGNAASPDSVAVLANQRACVGNLNLSDKDIIAVQGKINKTFTATTCSGSSDPVSLPNKALFSVGDILTFKLNVCNSGDSALTNVRIHDTLYNPDNIGTQFHLHNPHFLRSIPNGCATTPAIEATQATTIDFQLSDVPPKPQGAIASICSVIMTAQLAPLTDPNAPFARFQNMGFITSAQMNKVISTPPYLFSLTGVPQRNETAPNGTTSPPIE